MTQPKSRLVWEPSPTGVDLEIDNVAFSLPMTVVREFRDDMEEAAMLSRGLEKRELMVDEVDKDDWIIVMGDAYRVHSVLESRFNWIIQFDLNQYSEEPCEVMLPPDHQVTVWRPVA